MDLTQVSLVGMMVVVFTDAIKDIFPKIGGNVTRLMALVIGALIGFLAQKGFLPGITIDFVGGIMAGITAVAGHTLVRQMNY